MSEPRDLVERLRHMETNADDRYLSELAHHAADEIERLQATLSEVVDDTVLIDGFPAMRGTPDLPQYFAQKRKEHEDYIETVEAITAALRARIEAAVDALESTTAITWHDDLLRILRGTEEK